MNNTSRKLLAMLLCLVLLAGLFPAALAEEPAGAIAPVTGEETGRIEPALDPAAEEDAPTSGSCGENLTWTLGADGTLTVSGNGPMTDYEWDDDQSEITAPWADSKDRIRKVVLEDGVTSIGNEAFDGCGNLTEVQLPDGLTRIGEFGLQACGFTEIALPESLTEFGDGAFYGCSALQTIELPSGITEIFMYLFCECTSLASVTIPASVTEIVEYAFYGCSALSRISFRGTMEQWKSISVGTANEPLHFVVIDCSDGTIDYSNSCGPNLTWSFEESSGTLTISGTGALWDNAYPWSDLRGEIRRVVVEEGVTVLSDTSTTLGPFQDCVNLTQVSLPEGLVTLGWRCFQNCDSLVEVALPASLQKINQSAFGDCDSLLRLPVPEESETFTFSDGVLYSKDLTTLVLCPGGKSGEFTVPDRVVAFSLRAFWGCRKLTAVHIPDTVTDLGNNTFQYCVSLREVNIPTGVTQLPISCFYGCSSLEEITIPASITSIYGATFYDCPSLKKVIFLGSAPEIQSSTIFDTSVTATAYYPAGDESWTEEYRLSLGGNITWIGMDSTLVNIPDPAFRAWLEENSDMNGDGILTEKELAAITRMEIAGLDIASLEGIQYFSQLQVLDCSNNSLTSLDLSGNPNLVSLDCSGNALTSLDLSGCPALERLACYHNEMTFLALGFCPTLAEAAKGASRTGSLGADVLLYGGSGEDFVLAVDKKLSLETPEGAIPIVAVCFPDPAFRAYVEKNHDPDGDGLLSPEELAAVTSIECNGEGWQSRGEIRSLQGIAYFARLQYLSFSYNHVPTIDLSGNPELTSLYCEYVDLTALDLSANPKLRYLSCYGNALTELDLSANPELIFCECGHNNITGLDLSANPNLVTFYCFGMDSLVKLDVSANAQLRNLGTENTAIGAIDVSGNPKLEYLNVFDCGLRELDLSHNPKLTHLTCFTNELTSLDLSNNPVLMELICYGNQLTMLDLSANPALAYLDCHGNQLTELDLCANPELDFLFCYDNRLEMLDLSVCPSLAETAGTEPAALEDYGSGVIGYGAYQDYDTIQYHLIVDGSTRLVTAVIPGDLDANGTVESGDLLRLRRYLVGLEPSVNHIAADVTGDGKVDILDLVRLRKYLAGVEVPLG